MQDSGIVFARVREVNISPKHAFVVMDAIRGMPLVKAEEYLEKVIAKEACVPFKKHKTGIGHRKGGVIGKYPVRASKEILKLVKNAKNNAENAGLDKEKLVIAHAKADKGRTLTRRAPKGRWRINNIVLTNMEIGVKEI